MATTKKYWKSYDELADSPVAQKLAQNEFAEEIPVEDFLGDNDLLSNSNTTRRDFLKYLGFSTAAATLAACESPVIESIPYVIKPNDLTPGMPGYYASTYYDGHEFASVLVKTREGRPIKIEPNDTAVFNSSTGPRVQASVLSLYDNNRLRKPMMNGEATSWDEVYRSLKSALESADSQGKQIVLLTASVISPSTHRIIAELGALYNNFRHVTHDAVSYSNKLDVWEQVMGVRAMPTYDLSRADLVVGVGADFLANYTGQDLAGAYAERRTPGEGMNRHIQIETQLSLTGSNADKRIKVRASQQGAALLHLYNAIASAAGRSTLKTADLPAEVKTSVEGVARELIAARGKSLVLAGNNNAAQEALAVGINHLLDNLGSTVITEVPVYLRSGNDAEVAALAGDMKSGKVGALITWGVNPAYTMNPALGFMENLDKVETTAALTDRMDETASLFGYALPVNHYLESWGDFMPTATVYGTSQPTIRPLFDSVHAQDILLALTGQESDYKSYLKKFYASEMESDLGMAWGQALHDGSHNVLNKASVNASVEALNLDDAANRANQDSKGAGQFEIVFYQKNGMGNGNQANNPWLQELPDPISRVTWDNYLTVSQADAVQLEVENSTTGNGAYNGKYVNLTVNGTPLEKVPVFVQPGQMPGTVGLAVGYGREKVGKAGDQVGVNAYKLMNGDHYAIDVTIEKTDGKHEFACTQLAHTMMGRKIVNETTLEDFMKKPKDAWNEQPAFATYEGVKPADKVNLWESFDHETGHMWNMSMDLNKCIGCGACVIACHAENNVPVVGKDEVRRSRDMHWLRIDRYYSSDMTREVAEEEGVGAIKMYRAMEKASESPSVVFQPVMCQHCNHAPCETVCPVAATTHSAEGLNHMAYNRCIGTRYCANNCPYKVRRFNWFNYQGNDKFAEVNPSMDEYGRMVLNPDVVVRARGVMEKCSMCIQRIQYAKLEAKKAGEPIEDGSFTTACAQACGTGAITFGDVNDQKSQVLAARKDKRAYHLLEEVGTQPSVFYQTKVRNA